MSNKIKKIISSTQKHFVDHEIIPGSLNLGVFSTDDELAGQVESRKNAKLIEEAGFNVVRSGKFGHRMNENVAKKIPVWIAEIEADEK